MAMKPEGDELRKRQDDFIRALEAEGGYTGNYTLQRRLEWDDEVYYAVRNSLSDEGCIRRGRGRGGTVRVITQPDAAAPEPEAPALEGTVAKSREGDLYDPIATVLRGNWARDNRFREHIVEVTARQGRRDTGGSWSRPDIVVAALRVFQFVPGRHFDVVTFEIKPWWSTSIQAIYEALAHRRAGTMAYAWFHVPEHKREELKDTLKRVCAEAERHGIGVIVASDPSDYGTWEELASPLRAEPEPELLNEFLAVQLPDDVKQKILKWFR